MLGQEKTGTHPPGRIDAAGLDNGQGVADRFEIVALVVLALVDDLTVVQMNLKFVDINVTRSGHMIWPWGALPHLPQKVLHNERPHLLMLHSYADGTRLVQWSCLHISPR